MDDKQFPKISLVTATYNRATYLERTIQSVLNQQYPNLEYIIIDGGSTDGTLDIIKKYESQLAYWVSEPDKGMYDAIQKGFEQSTGEIMCWLNSDDMYFKWTFDIVAEIFTTLEQVDWLTTNQLFVIDASDRPMSTFQIEGYSKQGYYRGEHLPHNNNRFGTEYIMQESTFWSRALWEKAGGRLNTSLKAAGDAELWLRFFQHADLYDVSVPLAQFRSHDNQITSGDNQTYHDEVEALYKEFSIKPYNLFTAFLRRTLKKHMPFRVRRFAMMLGYMHRSYRLKYDLNNKAWKIQRRYY